MIALHDNSPAVVGPGIYPMLYAFFDDHGVLRQDPFRLQVDAALGTQAAGVAILGLGTEVSKLTFDERVEVLEVVGIALMGANLSWRPSMAIRSPSRLSFRSEQFKAVRRH